MSCTSEKEGNQSDEADSFIQLTAVYLKSDFRKTGKRWNN